jgi:hypothetical protein
VLTPEDWKRFSVYAKHIKWIDSGDPAADISLAVATMALSRPVHHIFPTLRKVVWNAIHFSSLMDSVFFMFPTVTCLHIWVNGIEDNSQKFDEYCQEIRSRLPHLTELHIRTNSPASAFAAAVTGLVGDLPHLEECNLPKYGLTTELVLALSRLPKLQEVHSMTATGDPPSPIHISDTEAIDFYELAEGAFSSLTWLRLTVNFRNIRNLMVHAHAPQFLVALMCDALHNEAPHQIFELATAVAAACPHLEVLTLTSSVPTEAVDPQAYRACGWGSLRPVLKCRSLVELVVRHTLPLKITVENLEEIARDRTTWKYIKLAPFPAFHLSPRPTLNFSALLPFARYCPRLQGLGLFLDGNVQLPEVSKEVQFTSLIELELGYSPISEQNVGAVATFLAGICTTPVKIETEWETSPVVLTPGAELESRATQWKQVETLQNELCKSRSSMRAAIWEQETLEVGRRLEEAAPGI